MGFPVILRSLEGLMRSHRPFLIFLGLWIVVFCGLKTVQHLSFGTNALDLSLVDYGFYSTLKGEVMADPFHQYAFGRWDRSLGRLAYVPGRVKGWESHFAVHFTPILFLFIPFYIVFPGPLVLLYIEVIAVGLSAMFLFLIARDVMKDMVLPGIVAVIYLFFRQLLMGVMHDFHSESLFPVLILGGFYFLAVRKRMLPAFLFFVLALLVREDIGIYLFFMGIFIALKLKRRTFGLMLSAAGLGYALLALCLIIPFFRHQSGATGFYIYGAMYGQESGSLFQILGHILSHPGLLLQGVDFGAFLKVFIFGILAPLLFLPLMSSYGLLLIPPVAVMLLSKNPQMYTFGNHYGMTVLPFLFLALVYGLKNVRDALTSRAPGKAQRAVLLLALVLFLGNLANSSFWRIIDPARYRAIATYSGVKELAALIPPEASVAAQSALIPHLPKRKAVEMLPAFNGDDYVLVHRGINLWPYTREEFDNLLKALDANPAYALVGLRGEARLYKRKT
jgi:uncharacterized membrane protein